VKLQTAMLIKSILVSATLLCVATSCVNNEGVGKGSGSQTSSPINCYKYSNLNDTIILKLIHVGESITGALAYKMPQKNTSKGTIQGHMDGDVLIATFTPFIDSTTPRQIAFKLIGNYFVEGFGETYIENDRILFKNRNELHYNDTIKLKEYVCQ
jgi:hypothetical protein